MNTVRKFRLSWLLFACAVVVVVGAGAVWFVNRDADAKKDPPAPLAKDPPVPDGPAWFRDMTADSNLAFTHRNGEEEDRYTILESVGGGVALIDFDGDGLLDLFIPGGGTFEGDKLKGLPCKLFKNLGGWKFEDVTAKSGLESIDFYSHGCAVADYDRDGRPDLLVTGFGKVALFHNEDGKRFTDVTAKSGIHGGAWATSAGFADLTGNGYPDLYICNYCDWSLANNPVCKGKGAERDVCSPQRFKPVLHTLYHNNSDGTFKDVTKEQGLRDDGCGLGVILADLNADGMPDIYVANDATNNHLYFNRKGKLEEKGRLAGVAMDEHGLYNGSMGVDAADFDRTGRPSIFVTNFQGEIHALYNNMGKERFYYQSHPTGLASLSRHFVAFGTVFSDFDSDGWEDIVIVNGHALRHPEGSSLKQLPLLLRNIELRGRRSFQDWSVRGGSFFGVPAVGRGVGVGDLDNDGAPDLVVTNTNSPAVLLKNVATPAPRWLGVRLVGKKNRDYAGATVTLTTDKGVLTRFAKGGGSYLSAGDRRILFGLGPDAQPGRLTVRWPWGEEQHFDNLEANAYWELREGEALARRDK